MTSQIQVPDFSLPLPLASLVETGAAERIAVVGGPMPRDKVDVPVAPDVTPLDTQLFQDPADGSNFYWLPRYHIGEERVSGQDRYRIGFSVLEGVWRLSLRLDIRPARGMDDAASRFPILAHDLEVLLTYTLHGSTTSRKALPFQEILRDEEGVDATLVFTGLPQRDEVFAVLSDAARAPALIVRRKIKVAVPERREAALTEAATLNPRFVRTAVLAKRGPRTVTTRDLRVVRPIAPRKPTMTVRPIRPAPTAPAFPKPIVQFFGTKRVTIRGNQFDRYQLGLVNWNHYHKTLFARSPRLPPCGQNKNASRTWVDILDGRSGKRLYGYCAFGKPENLKSFTVSVKAGARPLRAIRVQLNDRQTKRKVTSNAVALRPAPPPEPQFVTIDADMEQAVEPTPFAFTKDLHGYIFDGLGQGNGDPGQPPSGGLLRHRETFDGTVHSYFQDAAERNVFFYLADDFRISRRGGPFRPPFMTLRVRSNGGSTENTDVTWDYAVVPRTDPARLAAARGKLATSTGQAPDDIEFQPYVTSAVTYTIQRPTESGRVTEQRQGSSLMLQGPIFDSLSIPVVDFQLAYDAMLGRTAGVLSGRVEIEVDGWDKETRPFVADFAHLAGPVLDISAETDEGQGILKLGLTNAIESPLTLDDLSLTATRDGVSAKFALGEAVAPGTAIAPGDTLAVSTALPALPGAGDVEFAVARGAMVAPDDEAILDAILDRSTLEYYRDIDVRAVPAVFNPPAGRPQDQVHAILVEFEGGETVALTADQPTVMARVDYPFDDVILREVSHDGTYRYTKMIVRIDGRQERDPEPRPSSSAILFLMVSP